MKGIKKSPRMLQPSKTPLWKRGSIVVDFISGLLMNPSRWDVVWVAIDRLIKLTLFIEMNMDYPLKNLFIKMISYLSGDWSVD